MEFINYIHDTEHVFDVDYHYEKPEEGSRWLPPSAGLIDYMAVTENGVDITGFLLQELLLQIEKACLVDRLAGFD